VHKLKGVLRSQVLMTT